MTGLDTKNARSFVDFFPANAPVVANAKRDPHLKSQREREDVMHRRVVERRPKERKMVDPSRYMISAKA